MEFDFSNKLKNLGGNAIRDIFSLLSAPDMISFAGGFPTLSTLPKREIREIANELMNGQDAERILQYGATEGYMPLRETACTYLERFGINGVTVQENIIVSGGQQAIDLMCKAFLNKGDVVLVEEPTYLAALHIIKSHEGVAIGVKGAADGLSMEDLEAKIKQYAPKFLYVVPTFSNPTGKTYSAGNRKQIAELTAKYGVVVLEDDPYSRLRFEGQPVPALKSFDEADNVVFVTSFSKIIAPGFRTAIVTGNSEILRKLTIGKQASDVHTGTVNQAIVDAYIRKGYLESHIKDVIPVYREKKEAMVDALKKHLPNEIKFQNPQGGLFIWGVIDMYMGFDCANEFQEVVKNCKVAYVSGDNFFASGRGRNTMRLNYSNATREQIYAGIERMSVYMKKKIKQYLDNL